MISSLARNRALPWAILFFALNCLKVEPSGVNAASRIAGLRAITENHTLNIDRYKDWTGDWALAPNGHYYSNKAPGGVLLGLPAFIAIDGLYNAVMAPPLDSEQRRPPPQCFELMLFTMFMQFLPFALLVLYAAAEFGTEMGPAGTHFFAIAALFGNTASIYMNTYFGHGLAATLVLGCFIAWLKRHYTLCGALIAASLLTEYGTAFVIPFFLAGTLLRERSWRPLASIMLGALPFAALWIWYHQTAFGSPFAPAIKFSNPAMITAPEKDGSGLWGMIGLIPTPFRLNKLLFGPERGIAYTQPWLLGTFPFLFVRTKLPKGAQLFLCGGLSALLWMNASIGGWDGGWTVGPRYLSQLFPAIALAMGLAWPDLSRPWRLLLSIGLGISVIFRIMIFPSTVIAPPVNLWILHWFFYEHFPFLSKPYFYLYAELTGFIVTAMWVARRETR